MTAERRLRAVLGGSTALMLVMSWPLWVGAGDVPRVPFVASMPAVRGPAAWAVFLTTVAAVLGFAALPRWRAWYGASVVLLAALILQDQHRFQPWAYQYAATGLFLAGLPGPEGLRLARWWYVGIYAYSGLSKLDASFCHELGRVFLTAGLRPFGVDPAAWPSAWRNAAVLTMPAWEVATAAALVRPGGRRVGLAGATALHFALIAVLGPAGLGHSAIVLVWNGAMLAEVWVAFSKGGEPGRKSAPRRWAAWPVRAAFAAGVALPLGERWGWCDAWPAHALYASHVGRLTVDLHESNLDRYPPPVRRRLGPAGNGPWRRLDLTGWSRDERGTPVYPEVRAGLGLADGLAARYGGPGPFRVTVLGPADRWTGRRPRTELLGLDAVRRHADRYRINARAGRDPDESDLRRRGLR